ncbi:MAG: hypothetical protein ACLUD2_14410 [Clostridium sp.]
MEYGSGRKKTVILAVGGTSADCSYGGNMLDQAGEEITVTGNEKICR